MSKNDSFKDQKSKGAKSAPEGNFDNIKSKYIVKQIFDNLPRNILLKIILRNKKLQQRVDVNIKDYIEYSYVIIDIEPAQNVYGRFINIINEEDKKYFKIYFDGKNEEINRTILYKNERVQNIRILIKSNMKNFTRLFEKCKCVESIKIQYLKQRNYYEMNKMFNDNISLKKINFDNDCEINIKYMVYMFANCPKLETINIDKFNTEKVVNMSYAFLGCKSLKELNCSNFNTKNVTNFHGMFQDCTSLTKIDLSNFDATSTIYITYMFFRCTSLKEVKLSNFDTSKIRKMYKCFSFCSSLKELDLSNFKISTTADRDNMFEGCPTKFIDKINLKIKII